MVRIFFAFCLSIIPALTSYSASMAQHAAGAAGKIVVCTSLGSSIIYTDIDGQPEAAPYSSINISKPADHKIQCSTLCKVSF